MARPPAPTDVREVQVIKHDRAFLACDRLGDVPASNHAALGLYLCATRFLSRLELTLDDSPLLLLHSSVEQNYAQTVHATCPGSGSDSMTPSGRRAGGSLAVTRHRLLSGSLFERIVISNPGGPARTLRARVAFDADFLDLAEVRSLAPDSAQGGQLQPVTVDRTTVAFACRGIDGVIRRTTLRFSPAPATLTEGYAEFALTLEAGGDLELGVEVTPEMGDEAAARRSPRDARQDLEQEYARWRKQCTRFRSTDEHLAGLLNRSVLDVRMLSWDDHAGRFWLDAGVPWFAAPRGRDSLIAAYECLGVNPDMAWSVLRGLAALQGTAEDPARGEQPGRIPDEIRVGDPTAEGEGSQARFVGVDATPLWLVLLTYAYAWTDDLKTVQELWPNALSALDWIDAHGDADGDGYVEEPQLPLVGTDPLARDGLSATVVHPDGTQAEGPVATVDAQGLVYQAKARMVRLARALGDEHLASRLVAEATALAERFDRDFWLPDLAFYARALDGRKRPVRTITSNPGQCLWSGIVGDDRAARVARRLVSPSLSSGWGVRGLAPRQPAFDPLGYHTGSVWPHDTALIAHGLKARGFDDEAMRVVDQLLGAGRHFALGRYPQLFSGHARKEVPVPVDHPTSCRPHAMSAGAAPLMLRSSLGLTADAPNGRLFVVRPRLPAGARRVDVLGMRVGEARLDITFSSVDGVTAVHVQRKEGQLDVLIRQ